MSVVVDPTAIQNEDGNGKGRHAYGCSCLALPKQSNSLSPGIFLPANPKPISCYQKQCGDRSPIEIEPAGGGQEMAVTVHVGVQDVRRRSIQIESIFQTEAGQPDCEHENQNN